MSREHWQFQSVDDEVEPCTEQYTWESSWFEKPKICHHSVTKRPSLTVRISSPHTQLEMKQKFGIETSQLANILWAHLNTFQTFNLFFLFILSEISTTGTYPGGSPSLSAFSEIFLLFPICPKILWTILGYTSFLIPKFFFRFLWILNPRIFL